MSLVVQLRTDEGEIRHVDSLEQALREAKRDFSIWKISFGLPNGERVRLVREGERFILRQFPTADELLGKSLDK